MLYSVYGNALSYYGNIGYASAPLPLRNYGGWPDTHPNIQDDSEDEDIKAISDEKVVAEVKSQARDLIDTNIAENIAIIKRLKVSLEATEDTRIRQVIRDDLEKARKDKVRQFQLRAMIDDEETAFILFN